MHDFGFQTPPLTPFGVALHRQDDALVALPRGRHGHVELNANTFILPELPASLVNDAISVARHFHRRDRCAMAIWLFVDTVDLTWSSAVPPQRCSRTCIRHALTAEALRECPPTHRLAGSVIAGLPLPTFNDVGPSAPNFDGRHIVVDLDDGWGMTRWVERVDGDAYMVAPKWQPDLQVLKAIEQYAVNLTVIGD